MSWIRIAFYFLSLDPKNSTYCNTFSPKNYLAMRCFELLEHKEWNTLLDYLSTSQGKNELRNYQQQGLFLTHKKELFSAPVEVISSVAKAFPEGFKMQCSVNGDKCALHFALENKYVNEDVIEELFEQKVGFPALTDSNGRIPLHIACISNLTRSHEIISLLLKKYKSGASKRDELNSYLPIHYAVVNKTVKMETIKLILDANARILVIDKQLLNEYFRGPYAFAYCSLLT